MAVKTVQAQAYVGKPQQQGGSRSIFIRASDKEVYNVKFKENNQAGSNSGDGLRVLQNEIVAAGLAHLLVIPTPEVVLMEVTSEFLEALGNEFLKTHHSTPVAPGFHFGSHRPRGLEDKPVVAHLEKCENKDSFAGIITFDIWTNNSDRKMDHCLIVHPDFFPRSYQVCTVDHGHCFSGPSWDNNIEQSVGIWCVAHMRDMANLIVGSEPFKKWLDQLQAITEEQIQEVIQEVPTEWNFIEPKRDALKKYILGQKDKVPDIIQQNRTLFPNWR